MAVKGKTITSWSFSRYSDYKQCPLKAKLKHIDKIKEPPNEAMARGADIHTMAEDYIKGKIARLPKELKGVEATIKELRALYKKLMAKKTTQSDMVVEDNWAFTKDWDQTRWDDWVHCWVRIKLDCAYIVKYVDKTVLIVRDWKTGKFREEKNEEYVEQLELYALAALILYPHVDEVQPILDYVDLGVVYPPANKPLVYTQKDLPRLKKLWEKRTKAMLSDTRFAPRPNNLCKWCHFRKNNAGNGGGQCKF